MATIRGAGETTTRWRPIGSAYRSRAALAVVSLFISGAVTFGGSGNAVSAHSSAAAVPATATQAGDPGTMGQWSAVLPSAQQVVNAHVLPTGRVMYWPAWFGDAPARIWDPATGVTTNAPFAGYNIFCTGEVFLPDGRMFVAGGSVDSVNPFGTDNTSIYDSSANRWTHLPAMAQARWYPTTTLLANGDVLVVSGENHQAHRSLLPQVWQTAAGSYRNLTTAEKWLPLYPWMYLAPNGRVFNAGPNGWTSYLNTSGTGTWDPPLARTNFGDRDIGEGTYGSSVMYDSGKILVMGGSDPATATAEVIDLNAANPTWRYVAPMASPRKQHVATILPDGKVLVIGGHSGPGKDNPAYPVYAAEMWDPATEQWTTLASMATFRGYHSTALVLPDGRVMSAGGENVGNNAELFSPPYLFRGPRPTITGAPTSVNYGAGFDVTTPQATDISKVTLLRLPSVTHGFDQNQRFASLAFTRQAGSVRVTAPTNPNTVPPGHYMMYVLNGAGVPSEAKVIRVGNLPTPPAPTGLTAASPVGSRRVDLRWTDTSGLETGSRIERSTNGTTFTSIATVPADVVTYANRSLTAGTRYWYRVRALNAAGVASSPSNTVSVTVR